MAGVCERGDEGERAAVQAGGRRANGRGRVGKSRGVKGSFANARLCYASAIQLDASLLPACVDALGRCCLSERRTADCIAYYKQAIEQSNMQSNMQSDTHSNTSSDTSSDTFSDTHANTHSNTSSDTHANTQSLYKGLVAAYLAVGNLPLAKQTLNEARETDASFAGREAENAIRQVENGMRAVQACMAEGAYAKCVEQLRCCRSFCPLWRMPFVLLLQCYVALGRGEEACALAREECGWVRALEEGREGGETVTLTTGLEEVEAVKAEVEGFDENFVFLVLLALLQRNQVQSAVTLCRLVRAKQKRVSDVLNRVVAFCEAYSENEVERMSLVLRGQFDLVEKELTGLLEKEEQLREDGIQIGEKVRSDLLTLRATSRFKQQHFREACGGQDNEE